VPWAAACAGCVLAIVAAVVFITRQHPEAGVPAPTPDAAAGGPAATSGPAATTDLPIPQQVNGTWAGTIRQKNPAFSFAVRLTLPGGSQHGSLSYPQIGCTGRLSLTSATRALLTFHLAITSGRSNCVDGVVRLAVHSGGTMTFTFVGPGGSNPAGTLTRR